MTPASKTKKSIQNNEQKAAGNIYIEKIMLAKIALTLFANPFIKSLTEVIP
jgi:hypothetical protein